MTRVARARRLSAVELLVDKVAARLAMRGVFIVIAQPAHFARHKASRGLLHDVAREVGELPDKWRDDSDDLCFCGGCESCGFTRGQHVCADELQAIIKESSK